MKNYFLLLALFFGSCATDTQSNEATRQYVMVALSDKVTAMHLSKNYKEDEMVDIRVNNRKLNIYVCQFIKNTTDLNELVDRLRNDKYIVKAEVIKTKI